MRAQHSLGSFSLCNAATRLVGNRSFIGYQRTRDPQKETAERLLAGELDKNLSLWRRLLRKLDDYTKNVLLADTGRLKRGQKSTPEHGKWIEYQMILNGPEPLPYVNSAVDYHFYMSRRLLLISDAILILEGNSWRAQGVLMDRQIGLFEQDVDLFLGKSCAEA